MEPNCKSKFNLDHIYCHTNDNNYIRANTGTPDVLALLKENKHLKAMLLLHLDLIQEQSDQLMTKDKLISTLREENNSLKLRLERVERRSQLRSHKNAEILPVVTVSTSSSSSTVGTLPTNTSNSVTTSAVTTAKTTIPISTVATTTVLNTFDDVEDKKENIPGISIVEPSLVPVVSSLISSATQQIPSPKPSSAVVTQQQQQSHHNNKYKICDETFLNDSIIGESNGKLISKIVLQRVQIPIGSSSTITTSSVTAKKFESSSSTSTSMKHQQKQKHKFMNESNEIRVKDSSLSSEQHLQNISIKTEPESHDGFEDNQLSSASTTTKTTTTTLNIHHQHHSSFKHNQKEQEHTNEQALNLSSPSSSLLSSSNQRKRRRLGFMTTKQPYSTREWEDEQPITEETNKEEVEALKAEEPNLEIPKWTIKEFTGLYSIEGTEDLSDEVFLKRHSKFEQDEKRRKKWDVQRIREQRTIERLRRRHYKDELNQDNQESQEITSFYPTLDQIKYIQITEDLPVQAFGECIPRLPPSEFSLPWLNSNGQTSKNSYNPSTSSSAVTLAVTSSSSLSSYSSSGSHTLPSTSSSLSFSQQQQQQQQQNQYQFSSILLSLFAGSSSNPNPTQLVFLKKKRRLQSQGTAGVSKKPRKSSVAGGK